jgi:muramoyltetrapeptide carboxypeptidase
MKMILPPYLKKGDKVAVIATARKVSREEMRAAIEIIQNWGLVVEEGRNLYGAHDQFSGLDEERAADLQIMLDDPSIRCIFCARGGYGTMRIVDRIDYAGFVNAPKWIAGYSDITALHMQIAQLGFGSVHGTMPINFQKNEEATLSLRKALFGEELRISSPHFELNRPGQAEGELIGGNLSLIYALLGSKTQPDTAGRILFLEDLDEYLYHIDRMMIALARAGLLSGITGLIVGGMTEMKDNAVPFGRTPAQIIDDILGKLNIPVCYNFPSGHIDRNLALRIGQTVQLQVAARGGELIMPA